MKTRNFILITFLTLLFFQLEAQNESHFGIRAGYSLSTWQGVALLLPDEVYNFETISGFHAGIYANLRLGDNVAIEPGVIYSQKGSDANGTINSMDFEGINTSVYLDGPLLVRFYVEGFNIFGGPQVSLLLSNKLEVDGVEEDTDEFFREMDVGLVLGLGYEFRNGLNFSVGYDIGLSNALLDKELLPDTGYNFLIESNNRVLKFSGGFNF